MEYMGRFGLKEEFMKLIRNEKANITVLQEMKNKFQYQRISM